MLMQIIIVHTIVIVVCGLVRNIARTTHFCVCYYTGNATTTYGVRTSFLSALEMLFILVVSVFVIIMVLCIIQVLLPVIMVCDPISHSVRNVGSSTRFCICYYTGNATTTYGGTRCGVRSDFLSTLEMLLNLVFSAVVMFMVVRILIMLLFVLVCDPSPTSLEMLVVLLVSVAALVMVIQIPVVLLIVIVRGPLR